MVVRAFFFEWLLRDADGCVVGSLKCNICSLQVRLKKEANYVQCTLLLKVVHKLRKPVSIFVFTKQQYVMKRHSSLLTHVNTTNNRWICSFQQSTIGFAAKQCVLGKKSTVCKTDKFWKKKLSFAGPKSVFRQSKAFLTFYVAFTANFFTAHLFQPFQFCSLWCNFLNPCAVSSVTFSTLYF